MALVRRASIVLMAGVVAIALVAGVHIKLGASESDVEDFRAAGRAETSLPEKAFRSALASRSRKRAAKMFAKDARRRALRHARWLKSPKAADYRRRSRTAFRSIGRLRAASVAVKHQPAVAVDPAWEPPSTLKGEKLSGYTSETVGRVELSGSASKGAEGGDSMLVQSLVGPIAVETSPGKFEKQDSSLQFNPDDQVFSPKRTSVSTTFAKKLAGGITVGSTGGPTLRARPKGLDVEGALLSGSKLFYANTATDTDTILEATPTGASIAWVLRSPQSDTTQSVELDTSSSSDVRLAPGGGAEIIVDGQVSALVSAPVAFDAQGTQLPVAYSRTGDGFSVTVDTSGRDVAYPIGIDPVITIPEGIVEDAGLESAYGLFDSFTPVASSPNPGRIVSQKLYSGSYPYELRSYVGPAASGYNYGGFYFDPVRSTTVVRASWQGVLKQAGISMQIGIINSSGWLPNQYGAYFNGSGVLLGAAPSQYAAGANTSLGSPVMVLSCAMDATVCPARRNGGENTAAYFEAGAQSNVPFGTETSSLGAYVYLSDSYAPELTATGAFPTQWSKSSTFTGSLRARDLSLGMGTAGLADGRSYNAFAWSVDGAPFVAQNSAGDYCEGSAANPCPEYFPDQSQPAFPVPKVQGVHDVTVRASDIVGNSTSQSYSMKIDDDAPVVNVSGRLGAFAVASTSNINARTLAESTPFTVTAIDGSTSSNGARRSGVKSLSVNLTTAPTGGTTIQNFNPGGGTEKLNIADCDQNANGSQNSCSLSISGTLEAPSISPGTYYLVTEARDYVGNATSKTYKLQVGVAKLEGMTEGQTTSRYLPVKVTRTQGSATQFRLQYRVSPFNWCEVSASAVRKASDGSQISAWPQDLTGVTSDKLVIDLSTLDLHFEDCEPHGVGLLGTEPQIRAVFEGAGVADLRASEDLSVRYDPKGRDSSDASQSVGPGSVNLATGNFTMSASDAVVDSYKANLEVGRTYDSRYSTSISSVLGPGWTLGIPTDSSGIAYKNLVDYADVRRADDDRYPAVQVVGVDGSAMTFELSEKQGEGGADKYVAETGLESLKLERIPWTSDSTRTAGFKLTDLDSGEVVEFTKSDDSSGLGGWLPEATSIPGGPNALTYKYETRTDGTKDISAAFSATGNSGISCGTDFAAIPRGCQALRFNYVTLAAGKRLQSIELRTYDPGDDVLAGMTTIEIARYEYDTSGRLTAAFDPRITPNLKTTYSYTQSGSHQLLTSVKPPGEEEYNLTFATDASERGRLLTVSRSALAAGTATTSIRYDIPRTTGASSSAPFDMTLANVSAWDQKSVPWSATAVFTPDQPPNGSPATNYGAALVKYLDPLGREVNTLSPGGRLDMTEYDDFGAVVRTLTAENRRRVMTYSSASERLSAANRFDSKSFYEPIREGSERRHLLKTLGPEHQMRLDDNSWVQGRARTDYAYDFGSPRSLSDLSKEPFDLVTTERSGADVAGVFRDVRKTTTAYGSTDEEWALRMPRLVTAGSDSGSLQIQRKFSVNADGQVTERFQPRSQSSATPSTTKFIYYSAGINQDDASCGNRPEWLGLICKETPGSQPTTSGLPKLPVKTITYNRLRQPRAIAETVVDAAGSTKTRTTSKTYDSAGRIDVESVTANDGSTAIKDTKHVYSSTSGREVETRFLNANGTTYKSVVRTFDSLGRQTNYADSEGHSSSVSSYDILSRPVTTNDGKATTTRTYDPTTGDVSQVVDSGAGTFSGSYDHDGRLTATTLPGGIVRSLQYDESGSVIYTAYTRTTGCSNNCVLYEQFAVENAHGQYNAFWENMQGQNPNNQYYDYDAVGRLTRVQDWRNDSGTYRCIGRTYAFDADSNRTSRRITPEGTSCSWTGGSLQSNSFDNADRLTNSGYVYDAFGRITTAPSSDTGGTGTFTASYHANDLVRSVSQNGLTQTFELDPMLRTASKAKSGTTTSTESYAYVDDSDSPAWTSVTSGGNATWTRTVDGVSGADAQQSSSGSVQLMIQNIRGDVVATSSTAGALANISKVDEFGVPKGVLPPGTKYAFHGSKQREAITSAGIVMMGVRLYQPEMGRFLQSDPVLGGTANPYEYPSDPIGNADLDGRLAIKTSKFSRKTGLKILNWMRRLDAIQVGANGVMGATACVAAAAAVGLPTGGTAGAWVGSFCGAAASLAASKLPRALKDQIKGLKKALTSSRKYGSGDVWVRYGVTVGLGGKGIIKITPKFKFWAHWYPYDPDLGKGGGSGGGGW